jgi:hypothetical protein
MNLKRIIKSDTNKVREKNEKAWGAYVIKTLTVTNLRLAFHSILWHKLERFQLFSTNRRDAAIASVAFRLS